MLWEVGFKRRAKYVESVELSTTDLPMQSPLHSTRVSCHLLCKVRALKELPATPQLARVQK